MTTLETRVRPAQKPGRSRQDYGTPPEFLRAVEAKFGRITHDLAAHAGNAVCVDYYGPEQDSLAQDWHRLQGRLWLNPPFGKVEPWARKCADAVGNWRTILLLTPAAIGTRWFAEHVHGLARVYALRPRLTFVGAHDPYPGDLILSVYDLGLEAGLECWRWK